MSQRFVEKSRHNRIVASSNAVSSQTANLWADRIEMAMKVVDGNVHKQTSFRLTMACELLFLSTLLVVFFLLEYEFGIGKKNAECEQWIAHRCLSPVQSQSWNEEKKNNCEMSRTHFGRIKINYLISSFCLKQANRPKLAYDPVVNCIRYVFNRIKI